MHGVQRRARKSYPVSRLSNDAVLSFTNGQSYAAALGASRSFTGVQIGMAYRYLSLSLSSFSALCISLSFFLSFFLSDTHSLTQFFDPSHSLSVSVSLFPCALTHTQGSFQYVRLLLRLSLWVRLDHSCIRPAKSAKLHG